MRQNTDEPIQYVIRYAEHASRDIDAEYVWLAENVSLEIANEWRNGLKAAIAGLATFPRGHSRVPENFRLEVRHLLFWRQGSQISHRVLFRFLNEEADAQDPPTIRIMHNSAFIASPLYTQRNPRYRSRTIKSCHVEWMVSLSRFKGVC